MFYVLIRELLYIAPKNKGTSLKNALDYLLKVAKRKSVVFLISDFIDDKYWSSLKIANRKHDLIGIRLFDPAEKLFPDLGVLKVKDPESGSSFWIDTSSNREMEKLESKIQSDFDAFQNKAKKIGFDIISVATDQDFVEPLISLFRKRDKR
ncbi:MAG: hypothetical protein ACJZ2B_04050 [Candidatus Neomarinimicrobiota bacterium]